MSDPRQYRDLFLERVSHAASGVFNRHTLSSIMAS
jgi:hypothetical protein